MPRAIAAAAAAGPLIWPLAAHAKAPRSPRVGVGPVARFPPISPPLSNTPATHARALGTYGRNEVAQSPHGSVVLVFGSRAGAGDGSDPLGCLPVFLSEMWCVSRVEAAVAAVSERVCARSVVGKWRATSAQRRVNR